MSLYEIKSDTALTQKAEEAALHIRVYKFSFENIFKRITFSDLKIFQIHRLQIH